MTLLDEVDELEDEDFNGMAFYPSQRPQYYLMPSVCQPKGPPTMAYPLAPQ
jgi:hypothetical protein